MSNEIRDQVVKQCRAVVHLAKALAETHEGIAAIIEAGHAGDLLDKVGRDTAFIMEALGDMLNEMDAVDDQRDEWLTPVFEEAQRRWPQESAETQEVPRG